VRFHGALVREVLIQKHGMHDGADGMAELPKNPWCLQLRSRSVDEPHNVYFWDITYDEFEHIAYLGWWAGVDLRPPDFNFQRYVVACLQKDAPVAAEKIARLNPQEVKILCKEIAAFLGEHTARPVVNRLNCKLPNVHGDEVLGVSHEFTESHSTGTACGSVQPDCIGQLCN
jgi:hypothetical protein